MTEAGGGTSADVPVHSTAACGDVWRRRHSSYLRQFSDGLFANFVGFSFNTQTCRSTAPHVAAAAAHLFPLWLTITQGLENRNWNQNRSFSTKTKPKSTENQKSTTVTTLLITIVTNEFMMSQNKWCLRLWISKSKVLGSLHTAIHKVILVLAYSGHNIIVIT